ncbi:nuclear pore complex Nup98-Nup96 isoform X1 [Brachionus plicatilis]|uniref:Nuclear pore complex protein Nup98-Nup96 n=1 Tax=Brachionus plicatilis TaxID=10195 RepID=A0A3M7RIN4_BRAPC|nr:nuclear pore complex Nup98-Nup96 isoform X1 [Brachionus plicatilis]
MNSGFSSFGSPSGFNAASSLFSSSQNRTGALFGNSTTTQPTSTTGSLFGSGSTTAPSTTGFGFGSTTTTTPATTQTGTGNVKFSALSGQDSVTKNGVQSTIQTNHQCITAMKEYEGKSLEELRLEDYQANRKFPQTTSGFGTSTGLFGSSAQSTSSGFGSSGLFSSSSTAAKPFGGFGSSTTTTTPSTSTSIFGSQTKPAFGSFGTTQPSTTSSPFGAFGTSTQPSTTTTAFGQSTQPSTGLFGTSTAPTTGTSLFGSTTPSTSTTGGLFGSSTQQNQQQKPLFGGFGSTTTNTASTTPAFSFGTSTTQPSQPTSSIFGQSTTQSPLSANKPFGGFGTTTGTTSTGFGSSTTTTPSTGLFGSTQQKPAFGLGSSTASTGTSGFGTGFGSTSQTGTTGTAGTGSLFSSGFGNQPSTTTQSPFGTAATTSSPFGSSTTTGGLFGSTQPAATTTGTGLFGSTIAPGTATTGFGSSGFGTGTQPSTQQSIFGTTTTPSTGGLFGTSTASQPATFSLGSTGTGSTGLSFGSQPSNTFGSGLAQPTQASQLAQPAAPTTQPLIQQQLMALSNSPYGTASLLKSQLQDYSKKEDIFKPVSPVAQKPYITEATSPTKVPSFLNQTLPEYKGGLSMTLKLTPKPITLTKSKKADLFEGLDEEETPVFYPRKNIKKLMFKPQADQAARLSTSNSSINGDCQFVRKTNYFGEQAQITNDLTNVSDDGTQTTDNQSENGLATVAHPAGIVLERPGYFTIPSMGELGAMVDSKSGDCLVENFAIGRVDYGCITFPGFTNLTNLNLDDIVHIRRKEVHVYPDDSKKPPVGQGLNKPAEVTLHRIWPSDKQTRMPITDPIRIHTMGYSKKIEKATIDMDAEFVDYDPVTGSWTFKVKHFSKYGLDDSEDEEVQVGEANGTKAALVDPAKKEKEMLERQLKVIENRRFELMKQPMKKLSTITNQQWDMIKEYAPKNDKKLVDTSSVDVSTDETSDADIETVDSDGNRKSVCKQLVLDAEESVIDENKENKLYPNLAEFAKRENKVKTLYPNLDSLESDAQPVEMVEDKQELVGGEQAMDEVDFQEEKFKDTRKLADVFFGDERESDFFAASFSDDYQFTKLGSFSHKPITTGGLLKRGLGGLSTIDQENRIKIGEISSRLSTSQIGDQFHGQPKVLKTNITEAHKKVVPKVLKPQLWNRFKAHKPIKSAQRCVPMDKNEEKVPSSESQLVPSESAKSLIELKDSYTHDFLWCLTDLGLFNSRRFKANWSMNPSCYTFTQLSSMTKNSTFRNLCQIKSLNTLSMTDQIPSSKLDKIKENMEKFLAIQLGLTDFVNRKNLSLLKTKNGNELIKNLDECAENMRNSIVGDNPDADNVENFRIVLNLCYKLWGDIPDELKSENSNLNMSQYEIEQIRKRLLSEWLTHVSSHRIEKECKSLKFNKNKENYLNAIFSYLSGNRLLDACNIAVENSDYRLALLISQSSGSNDTVRAIMKKQLKEWFESNSDRFINNERLKIYILISGELVYNISDLKNQLINVCENIDWKRQFGIHLWYQSLPINSITDALNLYENSVKNNICTMPVPSYIEERVSDGQNSPDLFDTCFHLIKLYCNSEYPIENIVLPQNHGSNQLDHRLTWHLTMALQALQYNHITKFSMETLHNSFASQLQSTGLWHWAVFVLMHIDDDQRREKFVRLYLSRNVSSQSELNDSERFLIDKLKLPSEWVYEYKALRAKYEHLDENQLELLLKAHKWNEAHHVLIEHIAPDLFITKKFEKLGVYLNMLSKESTCINRWNYGGLVYMDFIRLHGKQDILFKFEDDEEDKLVDNDMVSEINEQLMSLSTRLKEFDAKSSKKLLCSLTMSQLLLKYFNVLNEMMNVNDQEMEDIARKMTKQNIEKAEQETLLVPDQDLLRTVMLKKVIYSKMFIAQKATRSRK